MESLLRIKKFVGFTEDGLLIEKAKKNPNEVCEILGGIINNNLDEIGFDSRCFKKYKKDEDELLNYLEFGPKVIEGAFTCLKCGSKKISTNSKQVRRADESTTVFAKCVNCNNCWVV